MSNGKKQSDKPTTEVLAEKNAELEAEIRKLKNKVLKSDDATEMAKMRAQLDVLCQQQNRQTQLENEYADRKALYNSRVAKRKAKEAAIAEAVDKIENEVETKEPTPSAKTSEQSTTESKDFHDRQESKQPVSKDSPGQSLRPAGQGKGPSVLGEASDSKPSGSKTADTPSDS